MMQKSSPRRQIALCAVVLTAVGLAAAGTAKTQPRGDVQFLLGVASPETVARVRASCAAGEATADRAVWRQAGVKSLPDMVDGCVAALTRLGRDGTLGFVRDTRSAAPKPALAFDSGFVAAYRKAEPITSALPGMASVKPIAARCLAQAEPNVNLCSSAGYVYGARLARGEPVPTS